MCRYVNIYTWGALSISLVLFSAITVTAQKSAAPQATSAQVYQNIQVLKDLPAEELIPAMESMSVALGQDCSFCHTEDMARDDKENKQIARKMITITQTVNKDPVMGKTGIGCATCHRGSALAMTTLTRESPVQPEIYSRISDRVASAERLPTADEILAKYERALGGAEALSRVKTRVYSMRRTVEFGAVGMGVMPGEPSGVTDVVRYAKMPDKIIANHQHPDGSFLLWMGGCDGKECWNGESSHTHVKDNENGNPISKSSQGGAYRQNYFYGYMPLNLGRLKQEYSQIEVHDRQKIVVAIGPGKDLTRDAFLVIAHTKRVNDAGEYLYFDVETGLLLRRTNASQPDLFGPSSQQIDFSDYRDVGDGTKVPFLHLDQHFDEKSREVVTIVQDNVPIDDSVFTIPKTTRKTDRQAQ